MKFAVLALAALASVASAQRECNTNELIKVVVGPNGASCATASGYSATSGKLPTDDQFKVLCFNDACATYRSELKAVEPTECIITKVFGKDTPLYATLITPIEEKCKEIRGTTAPPSAPGQTTAPPSPGQTTAKPVVTPAPAC